MFQITEGTIYYRAPIKSSHGPMVEVLSWGCFSTLITRNCSLRRNVKVTQQMYYKHKNLLLCLLMVVAWIHYYLCSSHILKQDSGQNRVEVYNERKKVIGNQRSTHQPTLLLAEAKAAPYRLPLVHWKLCVVFIVVLFLSIKRKYL